MPGNLDIECVTEHFAQLLKGSVLIWHPAGEAHTTCMHDGPILLARGRGVVKGLLAAGTVFELSAGTVL